MAKKDADYLETHDELRSDCGNATGFEMQGHATTCSRFKTALLGACAEKDFLKNYNANPQSTNLNKFGELGLFQLTPRNKKEFTITKIKDSEGNWIRPTISKEGKYKGKDMYQAITLIVDDLLRKYKVTSKQSEDSSIATKDVKITQSGIIKFHKKFSAACDRELVF